MGDDATCPYSGCGLGVAVADAERAAADYTTRCQARRVRGAISG